MTVIDPMHNILLGIVKTVWLDGWIKTNTLRERTSTLKVPRELDDIHKYLSKVDTTSLHYLILTHCSSMPGWVARLPTQIGTPAEAP